MTKLKVLDLFSGIGGFSLGLERTGGFVTKAFCEIEEFPRRVLAKHWPKVPCYHDVRELTADVLRRDGISVDVICGGFPCQDLSLAGKGAGLEGERSGLWSEYARLVDELRPEYVIVENVAALLGRGLDRVLRDLASIRYNAEWHCIPASAIGAPHRRDRIWIIAHAQSLGRCQERSDAGGREKRSAAEGSFGGRSPQRRSVLANADRPRLEILINGEAGEFASTIGAHQWAVEPDVGRMAYGVPSRVDRLKGLGNAVVPQVVTLIGHAILEAERAA
ncbi:DNA cytosine methyltransferase [Rhizobium johnstonii]|uniref:DNA cytosine methyltransferase n=1 Tax=Rhizobium johnstonii TaxID=3019933 RepID=UPI003F97FAC2